jgi:hypothetical protein
MLHYDSYEPLASITDVLVGLARMAESLQTAAEHDMCDDEKAGDLSPDVSSEVWTSFKQGEDGNTSSGTTQQQWVNEFFFFFYRCFIH